MRKISFILIGLLLCSISYADKTIKNPFGGHRQKIADSIEDLTTVDHDLLDGLTDDDHTQYLLGNGTRALTGNWDTGAYEITTQNALVDDEAYGAGWNGSLEVPTKNAVYDKVETLGGGGGDFADGGEAGGADRTLGNTDNFDLGFLTNNTNRLHIQNDGMVGIGTTSPGTELEILGALSFNVSGTTAPLPSLTAVSHTLHARMLITPASGNANMNMFLAPSGTNDFSSFQCRNDSDPNSAGRLMFLADGAETAVVADSFGGGTATTSMYIGDYWSGVATSSLTDLSFWTQGTRRLTIDDNGFVNIGHSSKVSARLGELMETNTSANNGGIALGTWSATNTHHSLLEFVKSGSSTIGTQAAVSDGETIGQVSFRGSDGTAIKNMASIKIEADGVIGTNDTPGRMLFKTSPDGTSTLTTRLTIDNAGDIHIEADNQKLQFGTGKDAEIYYDGTDLIINPDAVGTGKAKVNGDLQATNYFSGDGSQGLSNTYTFGGGGTGDIATMTFKDGLLTAVTTVP